MNRKSGIIKTASNTDATASTPAPTIAIVGRPNVGKSTLFNRLIGRRRSIVGDEPGITRDRIYGQMEWGGRALLVVDTGGIIPEEKELIPAAIFEQAKVALDESSAIVLVVDGRSELSAPDLELARRLIRGGKPLFLAVNKIDAPQLESLTGEFHRLGIRNLYPISAEHGTGVAELLDAVLEILPAESPGAGVPESVEPSPEAAEPALEAKDAKDSGEVRIAIIGRPNVGKSTLLNALTGTGRAIVSPVPGTTRDAVDELVEHHGQALRFIDTAGIRRKGKTKLMAEKLSVVMARKHLEAADIALLVIDASEGVSALDATIAGYAHESGRSCVVVVNKWDLVASASTSSDGHHPSKRITTDRAEYERLVRDGLKFLNYAPMVFVSAKAGKERDMERIFAQVELVARERRKRIATSEMNRFLKAVDFERARVPANKQVKIYYLTQAGVSPPTFVLFTDRKIKLHFAYERFLENQIRRAFGFVGSPIRIKVRASE